MNIEQLETKLQTLLTREDPRRYIMYVHWRLDEYAPKIKTVNDALTRANEGERLELTKELLDFYLKEEAQTVERLFGYLPEKKDRRIMGTIVQQGRQFRIWNGIPSSVCRDFADSCGKNLVLHVHGEDTQPYIDTLLPRSEGYTDFLSDDWSRIRIWRGRGL